MIDALSKHEFFAGLTEEHLGKLASVATEIEVSAGQMVFDEGGTADAAYAIIEGSIALELDIAHRGHHILQTLHGGEMLGWSWMFPPHRWSFGALAIDPSRLIRLDGAELRRLQQEDLELGYEIMKRFAQVMTDRLAATRLQLVDFYGNTH